MSQPHQPILDAGPLHALIRDLVGRGFVAPQASGAGGQLR